MKISEHLKAAKALIDTPDKWTQGAYARNHQGYETRINSSDACQHCSYGALAAKEAPHACFMLLYKEMENNIIRFNDHHTHQEVMAMWDRAIELAEDDEAIIALKAE